jgi:hypothetical protein
MVGRCAEQKKDIEALWQHLDYHLWFALAYGCLHLTYKKDEIYNISFNGTCSHGSVVQHAKERGTSRQALYSAHARYST